ncbi:Metallo-dependent phosphatase-like protein [Mucor lusitanicus]|uniref:Metallo-dependent phosphatase-like protein n=1 Tax=Mucor circinelloides f. lusitanicus TaxID=29924 RepID=A0A8H4B7M9_MUCCL|nr:Metallo-dependent phosphatase-like protein [Mucor lusitanicus]
MHKSAILCVIVTLLCCLRAFQLYFSSTQELRSVEGHSWLPTSTKKLNFTRDSNTIDRLKNDSVVLGTASDNMFYFVHATDLHLSRFRPKGHTYHFLHFIQSILPVVKPEFVVVTGDLTDAKDKKRITSQQYIDEWDVYQTAIKEKVTVDWYDMRGNHDCFDLPSWQSRVNYYRTHGHSAGLIEQGKGVYSWQVNQPTGNYQFVAIDACPKRGPSRPLNFFGYLTSKTMDQLEHALIAKPYNHTFVFSHYPTSTMVFGVSKKGRTFRDLASHYSIYFCGHLHKLIAGLGDVLKSYDPVTKSLELELGDLKEHGLYRIVAVDHDLISFVDVQLPLDQIPKKGPVNAQGLVQPMQDGNIIWPHQVEPAPAILVTNPKDARFSIPSKEPLWRIRQSSHIRFLVFSNETIDKLQVEILIDGKLHPHEASFVGDTKNPLWAAAWDPSVFEDRKPHQLTVRVTASDGKVGLSNTVFRVDTHRIKIGGGSGEFIIKSKMSTVLQCITIFTMAIMLLLLLIPKFFAPQHDTDIYSKKRINRLLLRIHTIDQIAAKTPYLKLQKSILTWSYRFLQLPQDQPIVWHLTFVYILALLTLPWFRANFIPSADTNAERYGIFYMWGMVFGGEWVPIADTWMFAAEQVTFDVFGFFFLVTWRGTDANDLLCRGASAFHNSQRYPSDAKSSATPAAVKVKHRRQLNEMAWFKGMEVVYWLWRSSELVALASFYGGIWPTLVLNINVYWMLFSGYTLAWGKNGVMCKRRKQKNRLLVMVEGCVACQQHETVVSLVEDSEKKAPLTDDGTALNYNSSASINATTLTQEEEQQKVGFMSISSSSGSSSCSSSTPFDGLPHVKSRKRQLKI